MTCMNSEANGRNARMTIEYLSQSTIKLSQRKRMVKKFLEPEKGVTKTLWAEGTKGRLRQLRTQKQTCEA